MVFKLEDEACVSRTEGCLTTFYFFLSITVVYSRRRWKISGQLLRHQVFLKLRSRGLSRAAPAVSVITSPPQTISVCFRRDQNSNPTVAPAWISNPVPPERRTVDSFPHQLKDCFQTGIYCTSDII